jgi:protein phosphatase
VVPRIDDFVTIVVLAVGVALVLVGWRLRLRARASALQRAKPSALPRNEASRTEEITKVTPLSRGDSLDSVPRLPRLYADDDSDAPEHVSESTVSYVDQIGPRRQDASALSVVAAGLTDVGKRRTNEDRYLLLEDSDFCLYAVADGMGGHAAGEIASQMAIDHLSRAFRKEVTAGSKSEKRPVQANRLVWAIEEANEEIFEVGPKHTSTLRIGTTVVAALFLTDERCVFIGHVGDSRAYRLRDGAFKCLTLDHTFANRGVGGAMTDHLYRALGVKKSVKVDVAVASVEPGDAYLLCTDGLTKHVSDDEIEAMLAGNDMKRVAKKLIEAAKDAGGSDNIAVVVIRTRRDQKSGRVGLASLR